MRGLTAAGRIITGLFFVLAGVNKIVSYEATLAMMESAGLSPAMLLLPLTIFLELGGGLVLVIGRGRQWVFITALALAIFTLATNVVFHRFWEYEGLIYRLELSLFFKNLVVMASLFMIAGLVRTEWRRD